MTDAAEAQLRRVLAMVPQLADDEEHGIEELAQELGVSRETLLADLAALVERYDDPGGFTAEGVALLIENERVLLTSPYFRRPMRLTASELSALELGLAMLEAERPPEEHRAIGVARDRVRAAMAVLPAHAQADDPNARAGALVNDTTSAAHLSLARQAADGHRKLRIDYRRGDGQASGARVIHPFGVVAASGAWYLVAHCERSAQVRVFRADRVEKAEVLGETFVVPESFSLDTVVRDGRVLAVDPPAATMLVRYSPAIARWIAEREGRTLASDGSLTLEHPLADLSWAVRHVLQYGADAEVLEPSTVRAEIRARLRSMTGAA